MTVCTRKHATLKNRLPDERLIHRDQKDSRLEPKLGPHTLFRQFIQQGEPPIYKKPILTSVTMHLPEHLIETVIQVVRYHSKQRHPILPSLPN